MIQAVIHFFETPEEYCGFMKEILNPVGDLRVVAHAYKACDTCSHLQRCVAYAEPYEGKYGVGYKIVITSKGKYPRGRRPVNDRVIYVTDGYYFGRADENNQPWRHAHSTRHCESWEFFF